VLDYLNYERKKNGFRLTRLDASAHSMPDSPR
jgi:hypothetical protein